MRPRTGKLGVFLAAVLGMFVAGADARADGAGECVSAAESGQAARERGRLREARKQFVACGADSCPKALRLDCLRWLEEVDAAIPTVVFGAKDAHGGDLFDVRVLVDGERVVGHESGKAVPFDPGPHVVRFEPPRSKPIELRVLLRSGEHNRPVIATFDTDKEVAVDEASTKSLGARSSAGTPGERGVPTASWVLGGIGLAGLGSFALFGALGLQEKSTLRSQCGTQCTDAEVLGLKTKYVVADVSLAVGIVSLGLAAYFWLVDEAKPKTRVAR